jgi:hypothetical protein
MTSVEIVTKAINAMIAELEKVVESLEDIIKDFREVIIVLREEYLAKGGD